jgi:flagellar hook-associated protein 1 FlgK
VYGGVTLGDSYIPVFSALANQVQAGKTAAQFSTTAATNAATAKANQSGVNLDEEAARLMQYQQAYQASAKYLQVAQGTFDTLIQSFG